MIFEQNDLILKILDVLSVEQTNTKTKDINRHFSALSFRYEGTDTAIKPMVKSDEPIRLSDNSLCYFPPMIDYTRICKSDKMIVIHFEVLNFSSSIIEPYFPTNAEKYRTLFEEILACWNKKSVNYIYESTAVLYKIFAEIFKDNQRLNNVSSPIYNSIKYIDKNYLNKDFSLSIAAQKSFVSDSYFRKLFGKEYGISPKKYVIDKRLHHAATLIITGYYSIDKISSMCGYSDYRHFSSEFKKHFGISPSEYTYNYNQ